MNELALFAGAGGGILGGKLLGWRTVCAVERDAYAASILAQRQNDGLLEAFPIWSDVCSFDGKPWQGIVDVISGGFPCQDISTAGKGAGIDGEKSGLWKEFARIIREIRPRFAFVENSPALTSRGLGVVLGDLAAMGYHARWCVLGADDAGAPHYRKRIWILADSDGFREQQPQGDFREIRRRSCDGSEGKDVSDAMPARQWRDEREGENEKDAVPDIISSRQQVMPLAVRNEAKQSQPFRDCKDTSDALRERCNKVEQYDCRGTICEGSSSSTKQCFVNPGQSSWWESEPAVCGMANGVADPLDIHGVLESSFVGRVATGVPSAGSRITCLGNGQVPATAALAWRTLIGGMQ